MTLRTARPVRPKKESLHFPTHRLAIENVEHFCTDQDTGNEHYFFAIYLIHHVFERVHLGLSPGFACENGDKDAGVPAVPRFLHLAGRGRTKRSRPRP